MVNIDTTYIAPIKFYETKILMSSVPYKQREYFGSFPVLGSNSIIEFKSIYFAV